MAFAHSKDTRVFVNEVKLSASINSVSMTHERVASEVTTLEDSGARFTPGLNSGSINMGARFSAGGADFHYYVHNQAGVDNGLNMTVCPAGFAQGRPAFIGVADLSSYEVSSNVGDPVDIKAEAQGDDGVDWGIVLHPFQAETATGDGTSEDNDAATTNGGVAMLHVTNITGTTPTATIKIQHSDDDSVWVDLVAFTGLTTSSGSERKTVAGTVNQYLRESHTLGGTSPSYMYIASFARR